jgi:tRNA A-37 threonylcarbamoyl transferase component Bud32
MVDRFYGGDSTQPFFEVTSESRTINSRDTLLSSRGAGGGHTHTQFSPGDIIDTRYQVIGVIGRGGFGCVYKVFQVLLRKEFALKTLNPVNVTETTILRLRKEAQAASRLEHPNLVQALDFGMIEGIQPFLVMDLVEGPTLAEYLKEHGRVSVETALEIFIPLAQAIAYAHRQGVVHRDLKPSNVILSPDRTRNAQFIPKIVDFGIAKIKFSDESRMMSLTATGDIFGTPLYMSPEQCSGTGVDARSDIYSLGCMFFEALTGAPPFNGNNPLEVMMQHGSATLPTLKDASLGENFAPELERIVASMLTKLPSERYADSQILADDLFWLKHGEVARISVAQKPDAVELKKVASNKSIIYKALLAIVCTIIGALIGYGVALGTRPAPAVVENTADDSKIFDIGSDIKEAYLSENLKNGSKKFRFQPIKNINQLHDLEMGWGTFHWWTDKGQHKEAKIPTDGKSVTVPEDARLFYRVGYNSSQFPYTWARFNHNDLTGIVLDGNMCSYEDTTIDTVFNSFIQQHNLKVLFVRNCTASIHSIKSLAYLSSLRWLDLNMVPTAYQYKEITPSLLDGKEIANFSYLPDLRVLSIELMRDVSVVLPKLSSENLRALSLARDVVTDEDLQSLSRFKNLEILNLRECRVGRKDIDGDKLIGVLMELKNLKKFAIDAAVLDKMSPENLKLLKSKHMKILARKDKHHDPEQSVLDAAGASTEGATQRAERELYEDQEWLDCTKVDPKTLGV